MNRRRCALTSAVRVCLRMRAPSASLLTLHTWPCPRDNGHSSVVVGSVNLRIIFILQAVNGQ